MLTQQPLSPPQLQALKDLPVKWVKTQDDLFALLDEIESVDTITLDTEFIKRDTFFPILALIQINTGNAIYLLDAPKLYLEEFWEVIADVPMMVLHACGEDLGIYYLLSNLPALTNVFDTQIGLGFLTGEGSLGYQKSLNQTLDIHVDKGESQSDWLQRPLTHEQEQYAIDDVRYLLPMFDEIKRQLQAQNLWELAVEDCQSYTQELYAHFVTPDDEQYLNVADFRDTPEQLAMLQVLCEWREQLAKSINRPRTQILRPQALREIIEKPPHSMKQLGFTSTKPNVIRMYGQEILSLIDGVRKAEPSSYPPVLPLPYRSLSDSVQNQLQQATNAKAEILGIGENILIRKKWLSELYAYSLDNAYPLPKYLMGWRYEWVVAELVPILVQVIDKNQEISEDES
ncbi:MULTISPECIES: ribonuclease D [unclassified Moraxella]|uniref:ribonuclease D n=1 Tax=unclassified Moraxella TaxID=2685852 RepID=UPI003AF76EEA